MGVGMNEEAMMAMWMWRFPLTVKSKAQIKEIYDDEVVGNESNGSGKILEQKTREYHFPQICCDILTGIFGTSTI